MEIMPGIHSLPAGAAAFTGLYAPNIYLINGEEPALIDTGLGDMNVLASHLEYLKEKVRGRLKYIFLTHGHPDHLGGVLFLKRALGGEVVVHWSEEERVKKALGSAADCLVEDQDTVALREGDVRIIHTPGHCPGHVCYLLPQKGILFSGDHVPGRGTTVIVPPRGDMSLYIDSLRRLIPLSLKVVCPGHGPLVNNPRQKIGELMQHRLEREAQLLELLGRGGLSVEDLVKEIYPELDHRLRDMARGQILAHLIKLKNEGRVGHKETKWIRVVTGVKS